MQHGAKIYKHIILDTLSLPRSNNRSFVVKYTLSIVAAHHTVLGVPPNASLT